MEDYERSGSPKEAITDVNVELVHSLIMCDRRWRLHDIATQTAIIVEAVQSILTDILGMSKVSARCGPRMLTKDQKKSRLDIFKYHLSLCEDNPKEFSVKLWPKMRRVHHFDPKAKKAGYAMKSPWLTAS